jgi:hypothetical protein
MALRLTRRVFSGTFASGLGATLLAAPAIVRPPRPSGSAARSTRPLVDLPDGGVSDDAYEAVRKHFSEEEAVHLSVAIANINAWNRLGAGFRFAPPIPKRAAAAA